MGKCLVGKGGGECQSMAGHAVFPLHGANGHASLKHTQVGKQRHQRSDVGRNGNYLIIRHAQGIVLRIFKPSIHASWHRNGLRLCALALFGAQLGTAFVVGLTQHRHKQSFAIGAVRHEAVAMVWAVDGWVNVPISLHRNLHRFGTVLLHDVRHHFLVFLTIVGAGAVDEHASGAECLPNVGNDAFLQRGALLHQGRSPLVACFLVFAHHALATARHIGSHHIEEVMEFAQVVWSVVGDDAARTSPFHDILIQHTRTRRHNLVRHHHRIGRQR